MCSLVLQAFEEKLLLLSAGGLSYFFVVLSPALCCRSTVLLPSIKSFQNRLHQQSGNTSITSNDAVHGVSLQPSESSSSPVLASDQCLQSSAGSQPPLQSIPSQSVQSGRALSRRCVYGVYFHHLPVTSFARCTETWKQLQPPSEEKDELLTLPVVAAVNHGQSSTEVCHQLPLLLYLVHLAVGENCVSLQAGSGTVQYLLVRSFTTLGFLEFAIVVWFKLKPCGPSVELTPLWN